MSEIKHTFQVGRMNKDLDERLVPQGEYRNAENVEVRTSSGGNIGAVSTMSGTKQLESISATVNASGDLPSVMIGSIADEKTNKAFFFTTPQVEYDKYGHVIDTVAISSITSRVAYKDIIAQVNSSDTAVKPVVVDVFEIWNLDTLVSPTFITSSGGTSMTVSPTYINDFRAGMWMYAYKTDGDDALYSVNPDPLAEVWSDSLGNAQRGVKVKSVNTGTNTVYFYNNVSLTAANGADIHTFKLVAPRALSFNHHFPITGVNIIDDLLFWTDNNSEPKKINITRSLAGSPDWNTQTSLYIENPSLSNTVVLENINGLDQGNDGYLKESHLTVIKPAPRVAPVLSMSESERDGVLNGVINDFAMQVSEDVDPDQPSFESGDTFTVSITSQNTSAGQLTYEANDTIIFTNVSEDTGLTKTVRATLTGITPQTTMQVFSFQTEYTFSILSISSNITSADLTWVTTLEGSSKTMFEFKFVRFASRYKYEDGEYSPFSPWSEVAFLPGNFRYEPKEGYNLGMVNKLKRLRITDFVGEDSIRPDDVVGVDILYKDTLSPNVYVAKSITRGKDPEWPVMIQTGSDTSSIEITSEMIHMMLPSSQSLRAWDNVPRKALAQEITGNRLLYGNYLQNYNMPVDVSLTQFAKNTTIDPEAKIAHQSVKSLRRYKVGVVFGDKYGRETPVNTTGTRVVNGNRVAGDLFIEKEFAGFANKLIVKQNWWDSTGTILPSKWMDYCKYYIKEISSEYYTMAMDRWYEADDENVWLSFASADRNKIDEESYLILKKKHQRSEAVTEEARYKVIAISNEAPQFIKTEHRIIGELQLTSAAGLGAYMHTTIIDDDVVESMSTKIPAFTNFKGNGWARIKSTDDNGVVRYSEWVKVGRLATTLVGGSGGFSNNGVLELASGAFGDSADHAGDEIGGTFDDSTAYSWHVEIRDSVTVDKPEFDGRFFVKITNDTALINNVTGGAAEQDSYGVWKHLHLRHLTDQWTHTWEGDDNTGTSWSDWSWDMFNAGTIDEFAGCSNNVDDGGNTEAFWHAFGGSDLDTGVSAVDDVVNPAWWIDDISPIGGGTGTYGGDRGISDDGDVANAKMIISSLVPMSLSSSGMVANNVFRFDSDPNSVMYKILSVTYYNSTAEGQKNYRTSGYVFLPEDDEESCQACDVNDDDFCRRYTLEITFRNIGTEGALLEGWDGDNAVGIDTAVWDPRGEMRHDGKTGVGVTVLKKYNPNTDSILSNVDSAIWETEPKETVDIDLYYEASSSIPMVLSESNNESFAPVGSSVTCYRGGIAVELGEDLQPVVGEMRDSTVKVLEEVDGELSTTTVKKIAIGDILSFNHADNTITESKVLDHYSYDNGVTGVSSPTMTVEAADVSYEILADGIFPNIQITIALGEGVTPPLEGDQITAVDGDGNDLLPQGTLINAIAPGASAQTYDITLTTQITSEATNYDFTFQTVTGIYNLDPNVYKYKVELPWYNCYSFGNGAESNRIRDDFNAPTLGKGSKASTILEDYGEERRGGGLIYSGIYNSTSGVNNLNEFNVAEKITKDLNPTYGHVQALKTRDTNVVTFCEDKVLQILANKDALYNADGSSNVTASNAVLGDAKAFAGDYGISSNPESLAVDGYRMYFTDKQRGKVLRLSQDGLTPISDVGMSTWFKENLRNTNGYIVGSFDEVLDEYNLTMTSSKDYISGTNYTLSFNEKSKGWTSFRSFHPTTGLSINSKYMTGRDGGIWLHHDDSVDANSFYGKPYNSTIDIMFNDTAGSVKSFAAMNYEGSQAVVNEFTTSVVGDTTYYDGEYYNLNSKDGWYVESFETDLQSGTVTDFVKKEGKWFGYISGVGTTLSNLDASEFSVQGIGTVDTVSFPSGQATFNITIQNDPNQ